MDNSFIQWLVGQTGLMGVAALALLMLRRSYEDQLTAGKQHQADILRLYMETRAVLEANTAALRETIERLPATVTCPVFDNETLLAVLKTFMEKKV